MHSLSGGPLQPPRVPLPWLQQTLHAVLCSGGPQACWGVGLGTGSCPCVLGGTVALGSPLSTPFPDVRAQQQQSWANAIAALLRKATKPLADAPALLRSRVLSCSQPGGSSPSAPSRARVLGLWQHRPRHGQSVGGGSWG